MTLPRPPRPLIFPWQIAARIVTATVWGASLLAPPSARGDDPQGATPSPVTSQPTTAETSPAYWQVPALPAAVIQGGGIPPGWQPQAVAYQGIGPDGQPLTMYFAPTYVFTYKAGPPVPAATVNRRGWWGRPAAGTSPSTNPTASGWNYATSGAAPVPLTLPPGGPR
jgi:hypothetical protein